MVGKSKKITLEKLYDMVCELRTELDSIPNKVLKFIEISKLPKVCGNCKHWLKLDTTLAETIGHCLDFPEDPKEDEIFMLHTCDKDAEACENFEYRIDEEDN